MNGSCFRFAYLSWLCFLLAQGVSGQTRLRPSESYEIDPTWVKSTQYEKDTTVEAVILFDYGICTAEPYRGTKFEHRRRIKIFKKSALTEWANIVFDSDELRLNSFECTVYNLEDGKIVKSVIGEADLFKEDASKTRKKNALGAIPNAREGTVIDYTYTLKSHNYLIRNWTFQYSIPVVWSEYELFFPGGIFRVTASINGLYDLSDKVVKENGRRRKYIMVDVPSFSQEPQMPPESWYRSSIRFINSYKLVTNYKNWFSEEYLKDRLKKFGVVRDSAMMDTRIAGQITLDVSSSGDLTGKLVLKKSGYEVIKGREIIEEEGQESFLKAELGGNHYLVKKQEVIDEGEPTNNLILTYELSIPNQIQSSDSLLIVNPFVVLQEEKNPFLQPERKYPVDFGSRISRNMTTVLNIPEGYEIETLPGSIAIELPGRKGLFAVNSSRLGNQIFISSKLKLNKVIFNVDEYPALRELFMQVVAKKSEVVVLRKKTW